MSEPTHDPYFDSLMDYGEALVAAKSRTRRDSSRDLPQTPKEHWLLNPADWEGQLIPQREWIVPSLVPAYTVTLLTGDGATGKSLLALQLCAGMSLAREWIGTMPEPGRTLYFSAEDDADEMHRRLEAIRVFHNATYLDLADIRIRDNVGQDAILGDKGRFGKIEGTELFRELKRQIEAWTPKLIVIDTLADAFSGDENDRAHARHFIALLKQIAVDHRCTILVLAHPSLTGMATGTGMSGSTGWSNSVRSRLYFQTGKASDGSEPNPNLRTLTAKKSNYSGLAETIEVEWKNGVFVVSTAATGVDKLAAEAIVEDAFLMLLAKLTTQGRNVGPNPGVNFAPKIFEDEPGSQSIGRAAFAAAMKRLLEKGAIKVEPVGPASRLRSKLVIVGSQ
ncbi:MAG: AAA family ATPase [Methylocella sp.]